MLVYLLTKHALPLFLLQSILTNAALNLYFYLAITHCRDIIVDILYCIIMYHSTVVAAGDAVYLGCYEDQEADRDLSGDMSQSEDGNTIESCRNTCLKKGM